MGDYHSLKVWKKAHQLTLLVYEVTARFPDSERYGLTSQARRSAASIPTNLAEGCGRNSDAELARVGRISLGSANELEYQLLPARHLGILSPGDRASAMDALIEVKRMLASLINHLTDS